ncbi:MAG: factor activating pos9 [Chaenotheca gracillima]|nr:MAG: factor activating pos9 [Chaenotheca gracillima]
MREHPNIIITGTPGVGKTSHCEQLVTALTNGESGAKLRHVSINQIVKEKECHEGWDEEFQSWIVDEDKLLDALEPDALKGGLILDWHACDLFPKSWIDLVVVLRTDSSLLYDRLAARGYATKKLEENMDSEIMQVLLEEAREAYDEEIIVELKSDDADDIERNVERIEKWAENWTKDHDTAES